MESRSKELRKGGLRGQNLTTKRRGPEEKLCSDVHGGREPRTDSSDFAFPEHRPLLTSCELHFSFSPTFTTRSKVAADGILLASWDTEAAFACRLLCRRRLCLEGPSLEQLLDDEHSKDPALSHQPAPLPPLRPDIEAQTHGDEDW